MEGIDSDVSDNLSISRSVVALRTAYPTARILTEQVTAEAEHALFRCAIAFASGTVATGYGHETRGTSADSYAVAEGRAMERACAVPGYESDRFTDRGDSTASASTHH